MTKAKAFFIAGTDTDAGKTLVSTAMLTAAMKAGLSTSALKPVAAGTEETAQGRWNGDVVSLAACCSPALEMDLINPVCLDEPIAPHIAAKWTGISLDAAELAERCRPVLERGTDLTLVEGAGGWKVPLGDRETMADIARHLKLPVILVVGMRLGCLNHALLSAQAIAADGLVLAGWVANRIDPSMQACAENIATLEAMLPAPLLADIPWLEGEDIVAQAAAYMDPARILDT